MRNCFLKDIQNPNNPKINTLKLLLKYVWSKMLKKMLRKIARSRLQTVKAHGRNLDAPIIAKIRARLERYAD